MQNLSTIEMKKDLLLTSERLFCQHLSSRIIDKPLLSVWMILIPVFFVFYFWELKKYKASRIAFTKSLLLSRERALETAYRALRENKEIFVGEILEAADIPHECIPAYKEWIGLLTEHYYNLMSNEGESFEDLIRSTYATETAFKNFILRLNKTEHTFHATLVPHLSQENENVSEIISRMKKVSAQFRKQRVQEIYS